MNYMEPSSAASPPGSHRQADFLSQDLNAGMGNKYMELEGKQ